MDQLVTLTIDGVEVTVPPGTTVLDAASQVGIEIPTFCNHAKLIPVGACRMCLVEIEKVRGLQPACSTPVRPEMVVHTNTDEVRKARQAQLEFLLTNHPLDCPVCDAGGECELQDQTFVYGRDRSRFIEEKRHKAKARPLGQHVIMDQERCILCRRCERFLQEWADDVQLGVIERGCESYIDTFDGEPLTTIFSGNTVRVCPVGAITSRDFRFAARCWELSAADSICVDCAVGCNVSLQAKMNRFKRIVARENLEVNDEWLCDRGQFDHRFADPELRVTSPMVRRDGQLRPATWDEALNTIAERLRGIADTDGGDAIGLIGSARASNEANYLLQRLARACLRTNNVTMEGSPPARARLLPTTRRLDSPGLVVIVGMDLEAHAPLLELLGRHGGVMGTTQFLVIHPTATHLAKFGAWLQCRPGTEAILLNGLSYRFIEKGMSEAVPNLEGLWSWISGFTPQVVERESGVPADALQAAADRLANASRRTLIYGGEVARDGEAVKALTNLALVSKCEGPAYIPTEANAIGAADMGLTPDTLPGFQPYGDPRLMDRLGQFWGSGKMSQKTGLSLDGMRAALDEGALKALYVLGQPPAGLEGGAFLIVQTSWAGDVPDGADVVLPAASHAEAEGSYTNLCGRVQWARPGLRPMGESRPDWRILTQLGGRLGKAANWAFESVRQVFDEIAKGVPAYGGLSYEKLGREGALRAAEQGRLNVAEAKAPPTRARG